MRRRLWEQFLASNPDYVIPQQKSAILREIAQMLPSLTGPLDEFIEFGPGTEAVFHEKTAPLLRALKSRLYRPIDLCRNFLDDVEGAAHYAGLEQNPLR